MRFSSGQSSPACSPQQRLAGTLLFAWNPLVLLDPANGHNDVVMLLPVLLAVWFLANDRIPATLRGALALAALTLAAWVKYIPAPAGAPGAGCHLASAAHLAGARGAPSGWRGPSRSGVLTAAVAAPWPGLERSHGAGRSGARSFSHRRHWLCRSWQSKVGMERKQPVLWRRPRWPSLGWSIWRFWRGRAGCAGVRREQPGRPLGLTC